ncbi:HD domain-containing protein [Thermosipho ferrireducens]|uniref:HD domain-containing protein n=1 Tax=Thermosipho ferrireducens TaxID=2571116 RepID=A0ABX7S7J4_9BACT|nr:HD domain-containing phosphohydrolase [Thermosipho ferrireducens]QTA38189.1 HD domain-containing protein [Thermosipho ferrireducens]
MYAPFWIEGYEHSQKLVGRASEYVVNIEDVKFYLLFPDVNINILNIVLPEAKKEHLKVLTPKEKVPFVAAQLNSKIRLSSLLKAIQSNICSLVKAEAASILLFKEDHLEFMVTVGEASGKIESIPVPMESIAGTIFLEGKVMIFNDLESEKKHFKGVDKAAKFITKNIVGAPIWAGEKKVGVIEVLNKDMGFSKEDAEVIEIFAGLIGKKLLSTWEYERMSRLFKNIILAITTAIDKRDKYTHDHSKNVADYSLKIGQVLGLSENDLEKLEISAILHDVGKIGVPDDILLKSGKLTKEEFKVIQSHTTIGAEIISKIKYTTKEIISGALEHHEKLDGSGYPNGKSNGEISLYGRIIGVADIYDALATKRPYKEPWPKEKILKILFEDSEKGKLDKKVVSALKKALK